MKKKKWFFDKFCKMGVLRYISHLFQHSTFLVRYSIFSCLLLFCTNISIAQVTNVKAKLNNAQDQFTITYHLEKNEAKFWDIRVIAFIDEIRIDPSRAALSGDQGWSIRAGKSRRILWDAYTDVENIDGLVRFEVWASPTPILIPPSEPTDFLVGSATTLSGLVLLASGIPNLLKDEKTDPSLTIEDDPIIYYQTFCDPSSPHFDAPQVIPNQNGQKSACDEHLEVAAQTYRTASIRTWIGSGLTIIGSAVLLTKPFYRKMQLPKYLKNNGLSVAPVLQIGSDRKQLLPVANTGVRLTYNF